MVHHLKESLRITPTEVSIKGEPVILSDGTVTSRVHKDNAFTYKSIISEVSDISICNHNWMEEWKEYAEVLLRLRQEHGFALSLDYEIIVLDLNYPSLYFGDEFTLMLGKIGVMFSLYFYND